MWTIKKKQTSTPESVLMVDGKCNGINIRGQFAGDSFLFHLQIETQAFLLSIKSNSSNIFIRAFVFILLLMVFMLVFVVTTFFFVCRYFSFDILIAMYECIVYFVQSHCLWLIFLKFAQNQAYILHARKNQQNKSTNPSIWKRNNKHTR